MISQRPLHCPVTVVLQVFDLWLLWDSKVISK